MGYAQFKQKIPPLRDEASRQARRAAPPRVKHPRMEEAASTRLTRHLGDLPREPIQVLFPQDVVRRQGDQANHDRVSAPQCI